MKELSIEEKAKAYDEALERARQIHNEHKAQPFDVMLKVFSELAESDDEKVRKAIIELVKQNSDILNPLNQSNMLAWLEKQGEQKPADYEKANIQQKDFEPKSAMEAIKGKNTDNANKVEPNDYSSIDPYFFKPVDKVEPKFKIGDKIKLAREPKYPAREIVAIQDDAYYFDEVVHLPFSRQDEWELVEKNPAWSEEDEQYITDTLNLLSFGCSIHSISEVQDFLLSLKDRYTWKPSEEQFNNTSCTHLSKEEAESKVWKQ